MFLIYEYNMKYILVILLLIFIIYMYVSKKRHLFYGQIMTTPEQLKQGLMYRKHKLHDGEGMLFVMKHQSPVNSVWMKHTYLSLDVIFLDDSMKIIDYVENTAPLSTKSITSNESSSYILEMNQGSVKKHKLSKGDFIYFTEV